MSDMHDPYDDQLRSARYKAERDQARQECERLRARLRGSVPRDAYERKRAVWLRHIRECESALGSRRIEIKQLKNELAEECKRRGEPKYDAFMNEHGGEVAVAMSLMFIEGNGGIDAVNSRLMPEGMEWPRFEDGEPVKFGDKVPTIQRVSKIGLFSDGSFTLYNGFDSVPFKRGERVRSPAPKVLDADGVEICVGDEVWDVETGCKRIVRAVNDNETVEFDGYENRGWFSNFLTHRAPVIAADGRPLREGETVWSVDSGTRYTVEKNTDELIPIKCRSEMGTTVSLHPSQLTHERPVVDTWERLEEDARGISHDISWNLGNWSPSDFKEADDNVLARIESLIPRAKALAERGQ